MSKFINRVIVSTDSDKIAKEAIRNKAEVPFKRPKKLASNKSPEIKTWRHAINFLNKNNDIDLIVSVPTTSPLRKVSDIDNCIKRAIKNKFDIVFTVTESGKNPYFNIVEEKKKKNKFSLCYKEQNSKKTRCTQVL